MSRLLMSEKDLRRFYSFSQVDLETGCWDWTGANDEGRGQFWLQGRLYSSYAVSYNHFVGTVPEGFELGHIRQGDKCAFWEHVRPVTHLQNVREANTDDLERFPCRHPRVPENIQSQSSGGECCKVCARIRAAKQQGYTDRCMRCGYARCRCIELQWPLLFEVANG